MVIGFNSILVQLEEATLESVSRSPLRFNSILVQLEETSSRSKPLPQSCFNSILVQLEGGHVGSG